MPSRCSLGACGGADPAADGGAVTADPVALDHDDFMARVEERCMQTNEEITAVEEANPDETPEAAAAWMTGFADAIEGFTTDVRALEGTDADEAAVTAVTAELDEAVAAMRTAADGFAGGSDDFEGLAGPAFGALQQADTVAATGFGFLLSGCGEEAQQPDPAATLVAVTATDYAFEIADVTAGKVAFQMDNAGDEPHFMYVVRLKDGATIDEALAADEEGGDPDAFIDEDVGESVAVGPGGTAVLNADLTPGTYAMLCFVGNADGVPHAFLGMAEEFDVSG
jgi:hypothetical protein